MADLNIMPPILPALEKNMEQMLPAPDLMDWIRDTFISGKGPMVNPDHSHLEDASIGLLLTGIEYKKKGTRVLGTAQLGKVTGHKWAKPYKEYLYRSWFGYLPDFIITLNGRYLYYEADAPGRCALPEHELYHCGHEHDDYGDPLYDEEDRPKWYIRPHDVEEFYGVWRRYGNAAGPASRQLKMIFQEEPAMDLAVLRKACGV